MGDNVSDARVQYTPPSVFLRIANEHAHCSLRAQWQQSPQHGVDLCCIGNMNRFVDIYTAKGEQLAQLSGEGITAVPAVAQFHPTQDWVAGGTASGKLCLWM
jgi:WD repeat-containing protein 76